MSEIIPTGAFTSSHGPYSATTNGDAAAMRDSMDRVNNTFFGGAGNGTWVQMDLGSSVYVRDIKIMPVPGVASGGWGVIYTNSKYLLYSNDGSSWTNWGQISSSHTEKVYNRYYVNVTARYWRLATNAAMNQEAYIAVAEWRFFDHDTTNESLLGLVSSAIGSPVSTSPSVTTFLLYSFSLASAEISSPAGGTLTITGKHSFSLASAAIGSPAGDTLTLAQTRNFTLASAAVGSPVGGTLNLTQCRVFSLTSAAVGSPVGGTPSITQVQVLSMTSAVVAAPTAGTLSFVQGRVFSLTSGEIGGPTYDGYIYLPFNLSQVHRLSLSGAAIGSPATGSLSLGVGVNFSAVSGAVGSPVGGVLDLTQTFTFTMAPSVLGSPEAGDLLLTQHQAFSLTSGAIGSPVGGALNAYAIAMFSVASAAIGSPLAGDVSLSQTHVFDITDSSIGSPVAGTLNLTGTRRVLIATSFRALAYKSLS